MLRTPKRPVNRGGKGGGGRRRVATPSSRNAAGDTPGGAAASAVRRGILNALPLAIAQGLVVEELYSRMALHGEQSEAWNDVLCDLVHEMNAAKLMGKVLNHWNATMLSRDHILDAEARRRAALLDSFLTTLSQLRGKVSLDAVQLRLASVLDSEQLQRKRINFLEDKTFRDVLEVRALFLPDLAQGGAANGRPREQRPSTSDLYRAPQSSSSAPGGGAQCAHVQLYDGCPFVNPNECPFRSAEWVDEESFHATHMHRRYPRLKFPYAMQQLEYNKIYERRAERTANMNFRMYESRVRSGIPSPRPF